MSDMVIEIINVASSVVPTAKGSYSKLEVTYKNKSFQDKVESKPIMDFAAKEAYKALKDAKFGDIFFITRVKNDKGFWDWVKVSTDEQPQMVGNPNTPSKTTSINPTPRSTYETAEERAAKQLMIVRQSSISSAIALYQHKIFEKLNITGGMIIEMAKEFESYVMSKEEKNTFAEIPEELPYDLGN